MPHHLGERCRRANLNPAIGFPHAAEVFRLTQIDHYFGPLDAILQPVETVQPAGHYPGVGPILCKQRGRVIGGNRLEELERRHYITNYCHIPFS